MEISICIVRYENYNDCYKRAGCEGNISLVTLNEKEAYSFAIKEMCNHYQIISILEDLFRDKYDSSSERIKKFISYNREEVNKILNKFKNVIERFNTSNYTYIIDILFNIFELSKITNEFGNVNIIEELNIDELKKYHDSLNNFLIDRNGCFTMTPDYSRYEVTKHNLIINKN